jgi:hypothetical protein
MSRTYTGTVGRIVGVSSGLFWLVIGVSASIIIADVFGYLPYTVEQLFIQYFPWLLRVDGPNVSHVVVAAFFGTFAVIGLLYGSYQIKRALTQSEYSITVSSSSDGFGGDGGGGE